MFKHNKAQQSSNRVHISRDILCKRLWSWVVLTRAVTCNQWKDPLTISTVYLYHKIILYKFFVLLCQINIFEFEFEFRCYLRSLVAWTVWSHRIHRIQSGFTSKMYSEGCVTVISNYHCRSVLIKSYADLLSSASPNTNTNTNTNNG